MNGFSLCQATARMAQNSRSAGLIRKATTYVDHFGCFSSLLDHTLHRRLKDHRPTMLYTIFLMGHKAIFMKTLMPFCPTQLQTLHCQSLQALLVTNTYVRITVSICPLPPWAL